MKTSLQPYMEYFTHEFLIPMEKAKGRRRAKGVLYIGGKEGGRGEMRDSCRHFSLQSRNWNSKMSIFSSTSNTRCVHMLTHMETDRQTHTHSPPSFLLSSTRSIVYILQAEHSATHTMETLTRCVFGPIS